MSDGAALLKAIAAQPLEDTPRLAFADWCDENGQPDRADYIRLSIEIESWGQVGPEEARRAGVLIRRARRGDPVRLKANTKAAKLARRQLLLEKHEAEWRRGPKCERGAGSGTERVTDAAGDMDDRPCRDCDGVGDLGGLLKRIVYGTDRLDDGTEPVRVEFRRGFPESVRVPFGSDCWRTCGRCEGSGKAYGADRPFEGPPGACPVCRAGRIVPTDWLLAVVTHHPITPSPVCTRSTGDRI